MRCFTAHRRVTHLTRTNPDVRGPINVFLLRYYMMQKQENRATGEMIVFPFPKFV
jgi:hypothetical protein